MTDSVSDIFSQFANPLYGSSYAAGVAVSEFASKSSSTSSSSGVEFVFSASAISNLAQVGIDVSSLSSYSSASIYDSTGYPASLQADMSALFQALA